MKKLLAILLEHGKALDIPKETLNELKAELESSEDFDESKVSGIISKALVAKLNAVSTNASFDKKKLQEETYKAAERKLKGNLEELIKTTFGLEDVEYDGIEAYLEAAKAKVSSTSSSGALTEDDIKKHPVYLKLERENRKSIDNLKKEHETAIANIQQEFEKGKILDEVVAVGMKHFDSLKPILSSDPKKAANQRKLVEEIIRKNNYEKNTDGYLPLTADGKRIEDEFKNPVTFEKHIEALTGELFDFQVGEERKSPNEDLGGGGENNGGGTGSTLKKYRGALPKNQKELNQLLFDSKIEIEQRQELQAWSETANLPEQ